MLVLVLVLVLVCWCAGAGAGAGAQAHAKQKMALSRLPRLRTCYSALTIPCYVRARYHTRWGHADPHVLVQVLVCWCRYAGGAGAGTLVLVLVRTLRQLRHPRVVDAVVSQVQDEEAGEPVGDLKA